MQQDVGCAIMIIALKERIGALKRKEKKWRYWKERKMFISELVADYLILSSISNYMRFK